MNTITFGGVAKKHGIGRAGKIDTSNVSTRTEFVLAGMDIVDEPDEKYIEDENGKQTPIKTLWMDSSVVKKAIKMYQVKKDEFAKNGGNKATKSNSTSNLKDKKAEYKSKRVGKKATNDFDDFGDDENPDWIHISYKSQEDNRNQVLRSYKEGGKTRYIKLKK